MGKQTIFCDFDGPIVDVSDRYYNTYLTALQEIQVEHQRADQPTEGLPPVRAMAKDQFWSMKQHRIPDIEIALRSGLQASEIDSFLHRVKQLVNQRHLLHYDCLQPGIDWALHLLHKHNVRIVLVTLRCREQAVQFLGEHGLLPLFTDVYGTSNENVAYLNVVDYKINLLSKAWHDHLSRYGRPGQSWMIGDTEADIQAGQAVGIPTVAITSGIRCQSYLRKFDPSYTFETLLDAAHELVGRSFRLEERGCNMRIVRSLA